MQELTKILKNITIEKIIGEDSIFIKGIAFDSRQVKKDYAFFALTGTQTDGHNYISQAIKKGTSVVICQKLPGNITEKVTFIKVKNSAKALGICASNYYNNPSNKIKLIGITGTNGKTTTTTLLYQLFKKLGFNTGLISTVNNYINNTAITPTHTTPDPIQLNSLLNNMVNERCQYCFMEVSSHALDQDRVAGLTFKGGIFTNITHDHLDYHKTFAAYIKAKKTLFDTLGNDAFALINTDDKNGKMMVQNTKADAKTFSLQSFSDFTCRVIEKHFDGMLLKIDDTEVWTKLIGEFNAYNILSVYACAIILDQQKEYILKILSELEAVAGRFEYIHSKDGIISIVDYAHTPDALSNVLTTINQIRQGKEQLITVIGAGGNRDKSKRPEMAKVAAEKSDKVILTSDNPRDENPQEIINDMLVGIDEVMKKKVISIVDRKEAINTACLLANEKDIILVAGKGHETYQEINGVKYDFDDKKILEKIFNQK